MVTGGENRPKEKAKGKRFGKRRKEKGEANKVQNVLWDPRECTRGKIKRT